MKPIFEKINIQKYQSFYIEEVNKPYFTDLWHFHPEIEILYIREGSGTMYVGDSINKYNPGEVVIIGSNTPHVLVSDSDYKNVRNKQISSAICIQFLEGLIEKPSQEIPELLLINKFLNEAKRGIMFNNNTRNKLIKHIKNIPSKIGMNRLINLFIILDIMSMSKDIIYLSSPKYKPSIINLEDKKRIEIIFQYVIQEYPNKISLQEIASIVNLTPQSFCRYFKSRTNKTFAALVNEVRIGNACKLLIENNLTISQICYASGFNYLSNFNRQFKKIKKMTPSEFKLMTIKNNNFTPY